MDSFLSRKEQRFLACASEMAAMSDSPKAKIGCVVVQQSRIIGSGYSSNTRTSAVQAKIDTDYFKCDSQGKLHAESMALITLLKHRVNLSKATLYVYRRVQGGVGMSRPCPRCMKLIKQSGIRRIIYTTDCGVAKEKLDFN